MTTRYANGVTTAEHYANGNAYMLQDTHDPNITHHVYFPGVSKIRTARIDALVAALREIVGSSEGQDHGHPCMITWTEIAICKAALAADEEQL